MRLNFMTSKNSLNIKTIENLLEKEYNITNINSIIYKKNFSSITSQNKELSDIPNSNLFIFRPEYFIIYKYNNITENIIINFSDTSIGLKKLSYAQLQSQIANSSKSIYISKKGLSHDLYNTIFSNPGLENDLLSYNGKKIDLFRFNEEDSAFYREII